MTVSDFLFFLALAFACAEFVILRQRVPIKLPFLFSVGVALFAVGGFLSTFESYQAFHSLTVIGRTLFLTIFWFWLGTVVLQRRAHVTKAVQLWVASAAICGAAGILQIAGGHVFSDGPYGGGRASGFTTHANELGGVTGIAFLPALMLASQPGLSFGRRTGAYVMVLLTAGGLIVSGSVGSLLAAFVATVIWLAFNRLSVDALHVFATLAACSVAFITLQVIRGAPTPIDRFRSTTTGASDTAGVQEVGSVDQRIQTYRVAKARIEANPFVGVGLDIYSVTRPFGQENDMYDQHNLAIGLWYKTGLAGLVGMFLAFFAIFRSGWRAMLTSRTDREWQLAVALVGSVAAFVVYSMSEPILFARFGWVSAALVLALRAVQRDEEAAVSVAPAAIVPDTGRAVLAPARP
jgi:O-antigen ligase